MTNNATCEDTGVKQNLFLNALYKTCKRDENTKGILLMLYTLSHIKMIRKICYLWIDYFFVMEYNLHNSCVNSLKCLVWNDSATSFLSSWIIEVYQRKQFFSKMKRLLIKGVRKFFEYMFCKHNALIWALKIVLTYQWLFSNQFYSTLTTSKTYGL